jgi:hypothetical protein
MTTTTTELTPAQLRDRAYQALLRELGPVDFIRFLQQFEPGQGDYTRERAHWLDRLSAEQINQVLDEQARVRHK